MEGRSKSRVPDGSEARHYLRGLLLGPNAHHVCCRSHESARNGLDNPADSCGKDCARKKQAYLQDQRRDIDGMGIVAVTGGIIMVYLPILNPYQKLGPKSLVGGRESDSPDQRQLNNTPSIERST